MSLSYIFEMTRAKLSEICPKANGYNFLSGKGRKFFKISQPFTK
jgi:hypothetical protein